MHPIPATPEEVGDGEDRLVDVHSPEVPHSFHTQVLAMAQPGDQLWRCPRLSAPPFRSRAGPGLKTHRWIST